MLTRQNPQHYECDDFNAKHMALILQVAKGRAGFNECDSDQIRLAVTAVKICKGIHDATFVCGTESANSNHMIISHDLLELCCRFVQASASDCVHEL